MISLEHVVKSYPARRGVKRVIAGITATLPAGRDIGILGASGSGKSTLLRLLSGLTAPNRGRIRRSMSVSAPLGYAGTLDQQATGREMCRLLARLHGRAPDQLAGFVADFTELGPLLDERIARLSDTARTRLAYGLSFATPHDCYLVDDNMPVTEPDFAARCAEMFAERRRTASVIMAASTPEALQIVNGPVLELRYGLLHAHAPHKEAA